MLQSDPVVQELADAFDQALAPVLSVLDNFHSYLDPMLTPPDFLDWLAGWLAQPLDETWALERRRELVARAVELNRVRGTRAALAEQVRIYTGGEVEISDSGGSTYSTTGGGQLPGSAGFTCVVRVRVPDPKSVNLQRLSALVAAAKPAHIAHEIEVVAAT
jgi:phage tail-like protein